MNKLDQQIPPSPVPIVKVGRPIIGFMPYDEALKNFFTVRLYEDPEDDQTGRDVVPVTGPPRREYGIQSRLDEMKETTPIGGAVVHNQDQIVSLPAAALTRLNWTLDLRRWTRAHYRKLGWTEEGRAVVQSIAPMPFDVMYQLDLWTKFRTTMNQFTHQVAIKFFAREVWLPVDLGGVWGSRKIPLAMRNGGPEDLTELDGDEGDRAVRMSFTFVLRAWLIPEAGMIPTIRRVLADVYAANKNGAQPSDTMPYPEWLKVETATLSSLSLDPANENP